MADGPVIAYVIAKAVSERATRAVVGLFWRYVDWLVKLAS